MNTEETKLLLQLLDKATKLGFAELVIQFQDGKAVSATLMEKIKLR